MIELTSRQWGDVGYKLRNRKCPVCGEQGFALSELNYAQIGSKDMLTLSCAYCAHVEFYDVAGLAKMADKFNEECIRKGQRMRKD